MRAASEDALVCRSSTWADATSSRSLACQRALLRSDFFKKDLLCSDEQMTLMQAVCPRSALVNKALETLLPLTFGPITCCEKSNIPYTNTHKHTNTPSRSSPCTHRIPFEPPFSRVDPSPTTTQRRVHLSKVPRHSISCTFSKPRTNPSNTPLDSQS